MADGPSANGSRLAAEPQVRTAVQTDPAAAEAERLRRARTAAAIAGGPGGTDRAGDTLGDRDGGAPGATDAASGGRDAGRTVPAGGPKGPRRSLGLIAGAVALVAIGIAGALWASGGSSDSVSDATRQAWAASFAAAPPTRLNVVPAAEVDRALGEMQLPPAQQQQLRDDLANGRTRLVWLSFTDVMAEDGDMVRIESGPYAAQVTAVNTPTRVYLPEPPSGVVNVTGVRDGGGGITIAITSGGTPVNLPFMSVGQVVGIPTVTVP